MTTRPQAVITDYGPESLCTSGRDNTLVVAPDGKVSIGGPRQGKYQAPVGIPIDPSEWCEASHATCDCNPDVELPEWRWVEWQYGAHPMQTRERRPPRFCVACFERALENGWSLEDWSTIVELRAEEMARRAAA